MSMHKAIVGVGSNIDPWTHIEKAEQILASETDLRGIANYAVTRPVGVTDQADFVNGAYYVVTPLEREAFVAFLKDVENRLGRVRGPEKFGPRTMDLDLVAWDGDILDRDFYRYDHVRVPVSELIDRYRLKLKIHKTNNTEEENHGSDKRYTEPD